jgi:hypothetical protein
VFSLQGGYIANGSQAGRLAAAKKIACGSGARTPRYRPLRCILTPEWKIDIKSLTLGNQRDQLAKMVDGVAFGKNTMRNQFADAIRNITIQVTTFG